jgi:type II secretory pathway component PulM
VLKRWAAWPRGIRWLAGIAAIVLVLVIVWVLFVPAADGLAHHDVGSARGSLHESALDNARGRLLTLGAGLLAAAALLFTALNFNLLRGASEKTDEWQRRNYEQTEQGQVTDRYTKAIEQLGSSTIDVTLGGIHALERIARDSPETTLLFVFIVMRPRTLTPPVTEASPRPYCAAAINASRHSSGPNCDWAPRSRA